MKLRRKDPKMFADCDKFMKEKYADWNSNDWIKIDLHWSFMNSEREQKKWSETIKKPSTDNPIDMKKVMEQIQELKLKYEQLPEHTDDEAKNEAQRFYRKSQFSKPSYPGYRTNPTPTLASDGQRQWTPKTKNIPEQPTEVDIIWNYCKYPNHIARHCRKQFNDKMAQGAIKQETEVEAEESEEHLNEQHPG